MGGGGSAERPDESEAYRALAEQSATYFNRYRDVFVPLENQYIQSVFNAGDASQYAKAMGAADSAVQREFTPEMERYQRGLLAQGIDPSSGAFAAKTGEMYGQLGSARGLIAADAGINNTDRFLGGVQNVVKMGQGIASEAMQGQIGLAQSAEDKARSQAATAFADRSQTQQGLGAAAGMAAGLGYNYFSGG
jgi:hypothetical protein